MNEYTEKLIAADKQYLWHPFTQMQNWLASQPVVIDRAGRLLPYRHRRPPLHRRRKLAVVQCARPSCQKDRRRHPRPARQRRTQHACSGLGQTRSIELAEKLIKIAPPNLKKVFYSDSGATAVEIALKIAYQYFQNKGQKTRTKFIALENSYHGDTVGSVSVGGIGLFHSIFKSLLFESYFVPTPHPYRFNHPPVNRPACLRLPSARLASETVNRPPPNVQNTASTKSKTF